MTRLLYSIGAFLLMVGLCAGSVLAVFGTWAPTVQP